MKSAKLLLKPLLILGMLTPLSTVLSAVAGEGHVGNGGDGLALEFQSDFDTAWKTVQNSTSPDFINLKSININLKLPQLKVVTVDTPLESELGNVKQESTAINFPANQLILINRNRWSTIDNTHLKEGIALHEVLSLLGLESTGNYKYSAAYVMNLGLSATDLNQTFLFVENKAEYQEGNDFYSIVGHESLYKNHGLYTDIRIDYVIYKNGNPAISLQQNGGGTMYACGYGLYGGMKDSKDLPKSFIKVAQDAGKSFGFIVYGLGVCSASSQQQRVQLIVPINNSATIPYYKVKEVITADDPKVTVKDGQWAFWYLTQVYGKCGTSQSFYVPRLINLSQFNDLINGPLPDDLSSIPQFSMSYDSFHAYYLNGLFNKDAHSMNLSQQYFSSISNLPSWNESCGLPKSLDQVKEKQQAMDLLSEELKDFSSYR